MPCTLLADAANCGSADQEKIESCEVVEMAETHVCGTENNGVECKKVLQVKNTPSVNNSHRRSTRPSSTRQPSIISMLQSSSIKPNGVSTITPSDSAEATMTYLCDQRDDTPDGKRPREDGHKHQAVTVRLETGKEPVACPDCKQLPNDIQLYLGDSSEALEESVALVDPKLQLFNGDEDISDYDERLQHKLTQFTVYDRNCHLTAFDTGLLEKDKELFASGYLKPVYEEDVSWNGGVSCKEIGPINQWWTAGFDGGENALIGITTAYADYYLMAPSAEYAPFMDGVKVKCHMSKVIIEFLQDNQDATYEDLLNKLQTTVPPSGIPCFTEDSLIHHAQYIVDMVQNYDELADKDEFMLITAPCMRALIKLAGVTLGKRRAIHKSMQKKRTERPSQSRATVTPLVLDIFNAMFQGQIDDKDLKAARKRRCGICDRCQMPDCGKCPACFDMVKFGGSGRQKQSCFDRRCPNMAVNNAEDEDEEDRLDEVNDVASSRILHHSTRCSSAKAALVGPAIRAIGKRTFFSGIKINHSLVEPGDCVSVRPDDPTVPVYIARIQYIFEDHRKEKKIHVSWFYRGSDTVLSETANQQELFMVDECDDLGADSVISLVKVQHSSPGPDWCLKGGESVPESDGITSQGDGHSFFYQKWYDADFARFEDPPKVEDSLPCVLEPNFCFVCHRLNAERKRIKTCVGNHLEDFTTAAGRSYEAYDSACRNGVEYIVGTCCYIRPEGFAFVVKTEAVKSSTQLEKPSSVDEDMYPEFYRKSDHVKGSNDQCPEPYRIGRIEQIFCKKSTESNVFNISQIKIRVRKFYRPENTHRGQHLAYLSDFNKLYWSEEEAVVDFSLVEGRCSVVCGENIQTDMDDYFLQGSDRFYFTEAYNAEKREFTDLPANAFLMGMKGKGKGKGKGKSASAVVNSLADESREMIPVRRLRMLDVFAGCGGLSEGFHQARMAKSCWAIEKDKPTAQAFRLNNPRCAVFTDDCNVLLRKVMDGEMTDDFGQRLPLKGDVEILCGGPPCQGFSGMNRFNSREYSMFKNSLIASFLSYCDYYRPRFFVLENVRNFVSFKRSMVLKLALRCLVAMGYQCTFGILQAGSYGVAQTRRRAIILAAAPGEKLPSFPEPLYAFAAMQTSVVIDNRKYNCISHLGSTPYRTITVRDIMSDLPPIRNGCKTEETAYSDATETHFQRLVRESCFRSCLRDHICKDMSPLVATRMSYIPSASGADWRDLPNVVASLSDGTKTKKLQYTHNDKRNGRSANGGLRGVCSCAEDKACDATARQFNTLIPWCLPHTGNRHNHWAGLYGRVQWDGFFSTTITNPEPMGKQGRVLHPEQHRVVSVRECARSQGFPDAYRFYGNILDKHRQVGNAVPPPLAKCIGLEIRRSILWREEQEAQKSCLDIGGEKTKSEALINGGNTTDRAELSVRDMNGETSLGRYR